MNKFRSFLREAAATVADTLAILSAIRIIVLAVSVAVFGTAIIFGGFWADLAGFTGLAVVVMLLALGKSR